MTAEPDPLPLEGTIVLDLTRMLPGAVLARQLLDLGARLIKVEEPGSGDPMRMVPPQVGGIGVGFAVMMRGAESMTLDLKDPNHADRLRAMARRADVVVESFRPGTLERWGLGHQALREKNRRLIWCSMSSFGSDPNMADRLGHDLNFVAESGALRLLRDVGLPAIQLADVSGALLAASAILAALFDRERRGQGRVIEQPLAVAPLPFVTWAWAEESLSRGSAARDLLAGRCACYRTYRCRDGSELAVGTLEPKFWATLTRLLGVPEVAVAGYDPGEEGAAAAARVAAVFSEKPRDHWLALAREHGLPISPVHDLSEARESGVLAEAGLVEATPAPGGESVESPGPFHPSLGRTPSTPAPQVGEHTERVLREFGID